MTTDNMPSDEQLPALPEPGNRGRTGFGSLFTADQMRAAQREALALGAAQSQQEPVIVPSAAAPMALGCDLREVIEWAYKLGAIGHPDGAAAAIYQISERGRVYVEALKQVPLPVQGWVVPTIVSVGRNA